MANRSFVLDLDSKTSYRITGNGSFIKLPDSRNIIDLPNEIWFEQTKANQIRRNAQECLTYRNRQGKELLTGLRPITGNRWYEGNILRYDASKKTKIPLVVIISQDGQTIEIFRPLSRDKKTSGKERSLPEAFKSSRSKFLPDTRQR
jgi:hypothetical protein